MEEKDFKIIYDNFYNEYIDRYIIEVEDLYKKNNIEGDAENEAYSSCENILSKKRESLKINVAPYGTIYSIFKIRDSKVRNNDMNRLYSEHILPKCQKLNIEMNENLFEDLLNEFAVSDASIKVYSWFYKWSKLYKMMFELNDFSEFTLFRNCDHTENHSLFIKYHKRLYPSDYLINEDALGNAVVEVEETIQNKDDITEKEAKNFKIIEEHEPSLGMLYNDLKVYFIDSKKTSEQDFINVLSLGWDDHNSKIIFKCTTQLAAFVLRGLEFMFDNLSFDTVFNSKLIDSKFDKPLKDKNLSVSIGNLRKKIDIDLLNSKELAKINDIESIFKEYQD